MKKTLLLLALFSLIAVMTSCQKGEEVTVSKYFEAMKHNDKDTMGSMATQPKDIEFKKFEITSVEEPVVEPIRLQVLVKELTDLEVAKKKQFGIAKEKNFEKDDVLDELDETRRRAKKAELQKKLEEIEKELDEQKKIIGKFFKDISAVKKKINVEKGLIKQSTNMERNLELYTGESHTSKVNVKITMPDGNSGDYVFIVRKYLLKLKERPSNGRLIITMIATVDEYNAYLQKKEEAANTKTEEVAEEKPAEDAPKPATEEKKEEAK